MTDMKRTTISLPDELVAAIDTLRQRPEYSGLTYSEIIRRLIVAGLPGKQKRTTR